MNPRLIPLFVLLTLTAASHAADALDTAKIEQLTGLKGAMNQQEKVFQSQCSA